MTEDAYNSIKKDTGYRGFMTALSILTISSGMFGNNSTTVSSSNPYYYEAVSAFNDIQGELCVSSVLVDKARGDMLANGEENTEFFKQHQRKNVKLKITKIRKHISNFDFEEEFEEI